MLWLAVVTAVVAATRGLWSPCGLSMLSALNPTAERARGHRPAVTAAWYVFGAAVGGLLLGTVCALFAWLVGLVHLAPHVAFGIAALAAAITVTSDVRIAGWSLPDHPRQVNEQWLSAFRRWVYAAGFGVQIGAGVLTYVMTAATYLTAVLAVLAGPRNAVLVGMVYGVVRGSAAFVGLRATTPDRLRQLMARIDGLGAAALAGSVLTQICVCAIAAAHLVGLAASAVAGGAAGLVALISAVRRRRDLDAACGTVSSEQLLPERT